ncbi:MAG TPA: cytochrome c3 family protein [Candidatus Deferrimicrobium sp.]
MARKRTTAALALPIVSLALLFSGGLFFLAGSALAETVPQPIAFSHKIHVSDYKLNCRFCHSSTNKSQFANLPSVEKCMMCHRSIATDKPEVKKVAQYWNEKKPIPWNKVIDLPNHVYFPHKKMVNAGIPCLTCHPGMDQAATAEQKLEFGMGFCMDCHRKKKISIDCWACHY